MPLGRKMTALLQLILTLIPSAVAICYYPDGTVTPSDFPCFDGDEASFCCGSGYACLSNKICMLTDHTPKSAGDTTYVRGSCTDSSWRSGNCPSFCVNPDEPYKDNVSGGEGMVLCPNSTSKFYCNDFYTDGVNCARGEGLAVQGSVSPTIITTINFVSSSTSTPAATDSTSTSTTSSKGVPTSTRESTASSTGPARPSKDSISSGTIAGAAVGSVAGVVIIAGAAYFFFRRSRKTTTAELDGNRTSWFSTPPGQPKYGSDQEVAMKYQSPAQEVLLLLQNLKDGVDESCRRARPLQGLAHHEAGDSKHLVIWFL